MPVKASLSAQTLREAHNVSFHKKDMALDRDFTSLSSTQGYPTYGSGSITPYSS